MTRSQRRISQSRRKADIDNTEAFAERTEARKRMEQERCPERYRLIYQTNYPDILCGLMQAVSEHEESCERCKENIARDKSQLSQGASS